jgi:N utilization substance protein A
VILSRRDPELIRTLFELEVPEIADGLVEIRGVAREPGYRSKIAVESHAQGVDPVGACVGPRGSRVRMVVSELRGEKIDIIPWNTEPARFIAKALSPARVREVFVDDETREATVVVPEDQLALAIGKEGLNARLAARLTGWKVDIQSDVEFAQAEAAAAYAGAGAEGVDDEFSGRCAAILSNGKRCPNAALPGSRYCGVPGHRELASRRPAAQPPVRDGEPVEVPEAGVAAKRTSGGELGEAGGSPSSDEPQEVPLATSEEADELEPVARVNGDVSEAEEIATEEPRETVEPAPEALSAQRTSGRGLGEPGASPSSDLPAGVAAESADEEEDPASAA